MFNISDKYTVYLHDMLENGWNFPEYPIFDENYRTILNESICFWFENRQIGFDTVEMFTKHLKAKMNLIMPKYNMLFLARKTALEQQGAQFETWSETNGVNNSIGTGNSTSNNNAVQNATSQDTSLARMSDTPQNSVADIDNYLSSATKSESNNQSNTTTSNTNTSTSGTTNDTTTKLTSHTVGRNSYSLYLLKDSAFDIENNIINELNDLFLSVWG